MNKWMGHASDICVPKLEAKLSNKIEGRMVTVDTINIYHFMSCQNDLSESKKMLLAKRFTYRLQHGRDWRCLHGTWKHQIFKEVKLLQNIAAF